MNNINNTKKNSYKKEKFFSSNCPYCDTPHNLDEYYLDQYGNQFPIVKNLHSISTTNGLKQKWIEIHFCELCFNKFNVNKID